MTESKSVYKLVALFSFFGALYSCNSPIDSQNNQSTSTRLAAIQESIAELSSQVTALEARVAAGEPCTTTEFLAGTCAAGELPEDASVTTTFCIQQGRALELSAQYGAEIKAELDVGAGWPNVVWGKLTGKADIPVVLPPFIPIPTEVAGEGHFELGRGLDICVEVPIDPTVDQKQVIADLVTGANIQSGIRAKYHRRTDRLLNYAARRTPVAQAKAQLFAAQKGLATTQLRSPEESDNAFDTADEAVERFMSNGFQTHVRAADLLGDPIFADLASAADLPTSLTNVIRDPQQILDALRQVSAANACNQLGLDASVRGRFPNIDNLCDRLAALPNDQQVREVAGRVVTITSRVQSIFSGSQLQAFVCSNVALAVFSPDC